MLAVAINFLVLFTFLWLFERKRLELDAFLIAVAAIVPTLVVAVFRVGAFFLAPGLWVELVAPLLYFLTTLAVLWGVLSVPLARSFAYALALIVLNAVLVLIVSLTLEAG